MSDFGFFEVLASAPDMEQEAQREASDKLAAATYDVREQFGDFLFQARNIQEYRDRCALVKDDAIRLVGSHLMPVTGVMRRIGLTGRGGSLEKEFRHRIAGDHNRRRAISDPDSPGRPDAILNDDVVDTVKGPQTQMTADPNGNIWGSRRRADMTGPEMNNDETFQDHQGEELEPEGNFKGYLDSVDQGAPSKVDHDFVGEGHEHTEDPAHSDFVEGRRRRADAAGLGGAPDKLMTTDDIAGAGYTDPAWAGPQTTTQTADPAKVGSKVVRQYVAFCRRNRVPLTIGALERHGRRLSSNDYLTIAAALQRQAVAHPEEWENHPDLDERNPDRRRDVTERQLREEGVGGPHPGEGLTGRRRKKAAPDYLNKANEALTNLLNQRAEEFQETISPLQQALQVVQQAEQLQQAANPMGVQPPAGTVNVLPEQQGMPGDVGGGGGAPGGDPSGGGGGEGGDPAAAAMALAGGGGAPPDPTQQMAASRRRRGSSLTPEENKRMDNPHSPDGQWTPFREPHEHNGDDNGYCTHCGLPLDHGEHFPPPPSMRGGKRGGGSGKAKGAARPLTGAGGVLDLWNKYSQDPANTTRGTEDDINDFATQHGIGERGKSQLRQHLWGQGGQLATGVRKGAPFADYEDFSDCTSQNSDKRDPDAYCGEVKHRTEDKTGRKKQAWTGWGPAQENRGRSRVAGWEWDNHLLAYTANSPRTFTCACGNEMDVPGYHTCKCGKIYNGYVIGIGGDTHEASAEKYLVREIPVRPDVIVGATQGTPRRKVIRAQVKPVVQLVDPRTGNIHKLIDANRREAFGGIPHHPHGGQPPVDLSWHPTETLIKEHQTGDHPWHGDIGRELGYRAVHDDDDDAVHYLQHAASLLAVATRAWHDSVKPLGRDQIHKMRKDRQSWREAEEDALPFPSDHHPKTPELGATPDDWHSRSPKGQWTRGQAPRRKQPART